MAAVTPRATLEVASAPEVPAPAPCWSCHTLSPASGPGRSRPVLGRTAKVCRPRRVTAARGSDEPRSRKVPVPSLCVPVPGPRAFGGGRRGRQVSCGRLRVGSREWRAGGRQAPPARAREQQSARLAAEPGLGGLFRVFRSGPRVGCTPCSEFEKPLGPNSLTEPVDIRSVPCYSTARLTIVWHLSHSSSQPASRLLALPFGSFINIF